MKLEVDAEIYDGEDFPEILHDVPFTITWHVPGEELDANHIEIDQGSRSFEIHPHDTIMRDENGRIFVEVK